jgi:hypothetical protein
MAPGLYASHLEFACTIFDSVRHLEEDGLAKSIRNRHAPGNVNTNRVIESLAQTVAREAPVLGWASARNLHVQLHAHR